MGNELEKQTHPVPQKRPRVDSVIKISRWWFPIAISYPPIELTRIIFVWNNHIGADLVLELVEIWGCYLIGILTYIWVSNLFLKRVDR